MATILQTPNVVQGSTAGWDVPLKADLVAIRNVADGAQPAAGRGQVNGYAAVDGAGKVTNSDGSLPGGAPLGLVAGTATDAARFAALMASTERLILQGALEYSTHPVTQQVCRYRGHTDPGNNGDRVMGGGGMAPGDVWEQVP